MFSLALCVALSAVVPRAGPPLAARPEERALAWLAREVPLWSKKNRCYSCHHNGDAARALYAAARLGFSPPWPALADTTRWLERPARWDKNGGEGPFSDKKLARLQFAATLVEASAAGLARDKRSLELAGRLVAALQDPDGAWRVADDSLGSPTTHGTALATHLARRTLLRIDTVLGRPEDGLGPGRYREVVARCDRWLRKARPGTVLDAAAVLWALGRAADPPALEQKRRCLRLIRSGERRGGGWGPHVRSAAEVFDSAVVLLALADQEQTAEIKGLAKRGRAYLLAEQQRDGSWEETTRPSGAESYAQRLSTTAWATLALLSGGPKAKRN
jgi:hypothetical protein